MGIDLATWRARIGLNYYHKCRPLQTRWRGSGGRLYQPGVASWGVGEVMNDTSLVLKGCMAVITLSLILDCLVHPWFKGRGRCGKLRCHWQEATSQVRGTVDGGRILLLRAIVVVISLLLVIAGDVETNPGPEEPNLKALLNALHPVCTSWYSIGLELDIPHTTLDCFEQKHSDQLDLMREVLKYWLNTTVDPPPTWEAVVAALRSPIVDKKYIADHLELKYCTAVKQVEKSKEPTLKALLNALHPVRASWYNIGLELDIPHTTLDCFKLNCSDSSDLMREMLVHWLKTTVDPLPTWEAVVRALRSPIINEWFVAEQLESKHCLPVVQVEKSEEIMSRQQAQRMQSESPTTSTASHLFEGRSQKPPFGCGCGKCTFFSFIERGCPTPICSANFPYLNLSGLTHEQQQELRGRLQFESQQIMIQFQELVSATIESLMRRNVPLIKLQSHLMVLGAFDPVFKETQVPVFRHCLKELRAADTIPKVFLILNDYFSFFNYHIIEHIINNLGTFEDKAKLQKYKDDFNQYAKRRIFECQPEFGPISDTDHADIFLKVDSQYESYTVEEIERFRLKLSEILHISPQGILRLCRVDEGCIQLKFQIPFFVQQEIFPLSKEQERTLKAMSVIKLTCGTYQFSDNENSAHHDSFNIVEVYEPVNNVEHELDTDKDSAMELSKFTGRKSIALSEDHLNRELIKLDYELRVQYLAKAALTSVSYPTIWASTFQVRGAVDGAGTLLLRTIIVVVPLLLVIAGDVETNPGPEVSSLKVLLKALHPVCASWYNIGLELDIPHITLDCFKLNYSLQLDLLREVLRHWLDTAVDPRPTWEAVVTALKSPIVDEKYIAEQLESMFCAPMQCVKESTKVERSEGSHDNATVSSDGTPGQRSQSHGCFTPTSDSPTTSASRHSSSAHPIPSEGSQKTQFGCGCSRCTLSSFIERGCPTPFPSRNTFPYLNLTVLTREQQKNLGKRLELESRTMFEDFRDLVLATMNSLIGRSVTLDVLSAHVMHLRQSDRVIRIEKPEESLFSTKPTTVETIPNMFRVLEDYISFFDYHVIELIIKYLGTEEDKAGLQRYKEKFKQYAERRIFKYPQETGQANDADHTNIFVVLDSCYYKYTDKEIEWFCYQLCDILCVSSKGILHLYRVEKDCIQLTSLEQLSREWTPEAKKPQLNTDASDACTIETLLQELSDISGSEWFNFGIQLGVKDYALRNIDVNHKGDVQRCKTEMLRDWLQSGPTNPWKKLATTLQCIGKNVLAQNILEKHRTQ